MDSSIIKMLGEDIIELGNSVCNERILQVRKSLKEQQSDYRQYKKLVDTLVTNFRTYFRFEGILYDNEVCLKFVYWCKNEIEIVHSLMKDYEKEKLYEQYRCLNYVYIKLLDELNNYNLRRPIESTFKIGKNIGESLKSISEKHEVSKRMAQYEIIHGIFYKYMFKSIENEKIKIIFYHSGTERIKQFQNITDEPNFRELFGKDIDLIKSSKESLEVIFVNGSNIKFVYASDNARGYRYHYAVVDTNIDSEMFDNVVNPKGILFDIDKENKNLKDNYNIEFVDM